MSDNDNFFSNNDNNSASQSRVKLRVLGISTSQIQSGAFALILAELKGPRRLPVVVGGLEAQSIAIKLEGIIPPRPMTHDLFVSLMHAYGLQLEEAFIYKFEDGIFSSQLTFMDMEGKQVELDARTSDAIALAIRCGAPIYTTRAILDETGFVMEPASAEEEAAAEGSLEDDNPVDKRKEALKLLRGAMQKAIDAEDYEEASRLKKKIDKLEAEAEND